MSIKVAVTGGIGSGKSMVCAVFSALGAPVYQADVEARRLMNKDAFLRKSLEDLLGPEAYSGDELNRAWVAGRIFSDPELVKKVNALVHPAVHRDFLRWAGQQLFPYLIEEAALTFESGGAELFDYVVVVSAPEKLRIERVTSRDGSSEEQVRARMANQWSQEEKERKAHYVIINDNQTMILPQILALHAEWINKG